MLLNDLRITIIQTEIIWENKQENLRSLRSKLEKLCGETDLVVLPEMFSTGFSMRSDVLSESITGMTITTLQQWASEFNLAIAGSYIACENTSYFNRAFFITPEGDSVFYDKRHLFRMGGETEAFAAGDKKSIIHYRGWNICLLVCYDIRFPVWSRNVNNEYDLLIYVANWPAGRRSMWDILLKARAIENACYVCGVNRIGKDAFNIDYNGGSVVVSARGDVIAQVPDNEDHFATAKLNLKNLHLFREKFPTWKDADSFHID